MNKEENNNSLIFDALEGGVLFGAIGEYLRDVGQNVLFGNENIITNISGLNSYYAGSLAGGLAGVTGLFIDPIANAPVLVGFYILIDRYIEARIKCLKIDINEVASDIVFDSIAVILIILLISKNGYAKYLQNRRKRCGIDVSYENLEEDPDILLSVIIASYFLYKNYRKGLYNE